MIQELQARGVGLASLTENIDTPSPTAILIVHVFGALAEFERNLIGEREAKTAPAKETHRQRSTDHLKHC